MDNSRLKVRAWDKVNRRMRVVTAILLYSNEIDLEDNMGEPISMEHFELEFCTGLKDRNGKEIYEGDIVSFFAPNNDGYGGLSRTRKVVYHEELCGFGFEVNINGGPKFPLDYYINLIAQVQDIEVKGNIHENPELLQ